MKYLIIGSGGREHAIAWRLLNDGSAEEIYVAPGNGGIENKYRVDIQADDFEGIKKLCYEKKIDLVVIGPEVPLVNGLADFLGENGIRVFGPSGKAAMIEGSKLFAKRIMETYNVPTAGHWDFTGRKSLIEFIEKQEKYPLVIKLDGLAAGKGVAIPQNKEEAFAFVKENVKDDSRVFLEEFIEGEEASVLSISDGVTVIPLVAAQDHKRAFDGDMGPNTGGMGAYAPAPVVTPERMKFIRERVLQPVIDGMRGEGIPFKGILYAGVMISGDKITVLEFNARFGDPETQVILPLLDVKLGDMLNAAVDGTLGGFDLKFKKAHAMTVVVAAGGYPGSYDKGKAITGFDKVSDRLMVFHAGTVNRDGRILSNGGRVLNVTSIGSTLKEARQNIYDEIGKLEFEGSFYRKDIGYRAL
ncbi:MAG TPA: phosphoribosylamine--glycine ligase [Spirochaetota bacterium]|nr:phosphoribosylamine--glycine ligase [Spirochaetota bacterium]HPS88159.1 phosphoribosylamine--glycine ligase [Spirochaetota bacterium]